MSKFCSLLRGTSSIAKSFTWHFGFIQSLNSCVCVCVCAVAFNANHFRCISIKSFNMAMAKLTFWLLFKLKWKWRKSRRKLNRRFFSFCSSSCQSEELAKVYTHFSWLSSRANNIFFGHTTKQTTHTHQHKAHANMCIGRLPMNSSVYTLNAYAKFSRISKFNCTSSFNN